MDDQFRVMHELEERLESIILKTESVLNTEELSLLRWACGITLTSPKENHVSNIVKIENKYF